MKKTYILFITGILALSFCACGNSGAEMPESAANSDIQNLYKFMNCLIGYFLIHLTGY